MEDFFAGSARREFVIDAAAAIEFAAKAVIARYDAAALFRLDGQDELSADELFVIAPVVRSDRGTPSPSDWEAALERLLKRETITRRAAASEAARLASTHDEPVVDVAAANRLFTARNHALHIGDIDESRMNHHAADFVKVFTALTAALGELHQVMFGVLAPIADTRHMRTDRSSKVDVRVQVTLARRRFSYGVVAPLRRSGLAVAGETTRCPACGLHAHITTQPAQSAPQQGVSPTEWNQPISTLDCLYCGLTLYGDRQIRHAHREFPDVQPEPFDPLAEYR